MKIVIAPDSFKGSVSAGEICKMVAEGIIRVLPAAEIVKFPLADGGEGTVEKLAHATDGNFIKVDVTGPLGKKVTAKLGVLGDKKTAVIEMAQAFGLPLIKETEKNLLLTTSFWTGELIKHTLGLGLEILLLVLVAVLPMMVA